MRKRGILEAVGRRLTPILQRWRAVWEPVGAMLQRVAVAATGAVARPTHARRRRQLDVALRDLPAPPAVPSVSVITLAPWEEMPLPTVGEVAPEVVVAEPGSSRVASLARAADAATGDVLCFLPDPTDAPAEGWLPRLAAGIDRGVAATTPTLVRPAARGVPTPDDLLVRSAGYEIELDRRGVPVVRARCHGRRPESTADPADVAAAPLRALTVQRTAFADAGGLFDAGDDDAAAVDLITRLRAGGGQVRHVPTALVYDDRPTPSIRSLSHPVDPGGRAWARVVERCGPALVRAASSDPSASASWAITTAVPSARVAERWGDWHYAQALARSLRRAGHHVVVQRLDQADSLTGRSCDVHLVLHGLGSVRRTPGQRHILWVISHPESVTQQDCDDADLVLVASSRFAEHLRQRTTTPVEVLLQATDHRRFRPVEPRREHRHDVTVVAKTRDVRRAIVTDALDAGLRPAIYGGGWRSLVDPSLVVTDYVDNEDLPSVYCGAGVVLNDHWDAMRTWGFVSNRLFDVLACGTPVISDAVDGLAEIFGDAVPTYRTPTELRDLVHHALADPVAARDRARAGRTAVLAMHTFDHRAEALAALADRHLQRHHTRMGHQP